MSSDKPVIITSFIVPLCFLLEILEYFLPEFLFQAIAVKSEQAFQAVPGTEQKGTKIDLVSLAQKNRGGGTGWKEGNYIQELKGRDNFLCGWSIFWYFCKARTSLNKQNEVKNVFTYGRKNLRSVSTELTRRGQQVTGFCRIHS